MKRSILILISVLTVLGSAYGATTYLHPTETESPSNNTIYGKNNSGAFGFNSAITLDDSEAQIQNATDTTKKFKIDASGITTGTTRTFTAPDFDLARVNLLVVSATAPATPSNGQEWYQPRTNDTGGAILWRYSSALTKWVPERSYGDITFYIDYTDGTDDVDHGTGVDASAFKTRTFACASIPSIIGGNVTINEIAESRAEGFSFIGKRCANDAGNYTITVNGTLTQRETGTAVDAGSAQGSGATRGTLSDVDMINSTVAGDLIVSESNPGIYRVVYSVTANDSLTIVGTWPTAAPAEGSDWTSYYPGTVVDCAHAALSEACIIRDCNINFVFNNIEFKDGASNTFGAFSYTGTCTRNRCRFTTTASSYTYASREWYCGNAQFYDYQCYYDTAGNKLGVGTIYTTHFIYGSLFGATNQYSIVANTHSFVELFNGTSILNTGPQGTGVYAFNHGTITFENSATTGYEGIVGCTLGVKADNFGLVTGTANNIYSGNTADETATAASYGYID